MKFSINFSSIAILLAITSIGFVIIPSSAQQTSLDLTAPTVSELYGGEEKGSLEISVQNNTLSLTAVMNPVRQQLEVYEGWLEDKGDASGYSLSLGKFDESNTLTVNQTMINPYTYTIFYVTAEPMDDPDPNPSDVIAAAKLPTPFGQ
jgi:hypothetical protein